MMQRFTRFPQTLYRIQPRLPVKLRDYETQISKNRLSFDLKLHKGLVLPMQGNHFHTPNGMSLRQANDKMMNILSNFRGDLNLLRIYRMQENSPVPDDMVLILEHSDHYSLQTSKEVSLNDFNSKLTEYLQSLPSLTKEQFVEFYNDVDDQDN